MLDNIKFEREFNIEIETTVGKTSETSGDFITITRPLTIEFNIVRNVLASENSASIKIFNLSKRIRNLIYKDRYDTVVYRQVILRAGYTKESPIIFAGSLRSGESYRQGTEFITDINALDGGLDMYKTVSSNTTAKGSTKIDAIKNQLNNFTNIKNLTIGDFPGTYKRGRVFFGNTWDLLKLESNNKAFIDNQGLNILNDDEAKEGGIRVINSDAGLLDSPRRSKTMIVFKMLFEPRFIVGQELELISITNDIFNGIYKVAGINHAGTISDAVNGKCETEVSLSMGTQLLRVV